MGFVNLGSVFKSVGNIIKPLAQTAIQAIAPQAAGMLKGIVGDLFTAGKGALSSFLNVSGLPSPIKSLAEKLLPKGLDALKNLADGGIDKLLQMITGKPQNVTTSDGVNVTTPPMTQPGRTDSIVNNTPSGGTSSSSGAATATGGSGGSSGAATLDAAANSKWGWEGGAPDSSKYDLTSPGGAAKFQADMTKYQMAMSAVSNTFQALSNIFKSQADTQKAILSNFR
jgi:hypothetical protein